jgi:hypothetical protein
MTFRFVCLLQRVHWRSGVNAIKLVFFVQTNKLGLLSCTAFTALPEVWNLSQSLPQSLECRHNIQNWIIKCNNQYRMLSVTFKPFLQCLGTTVRVGSLYLLKICLQRLNRDKLRSLFVQIVSDKENKGFTTLPVGVTSPNLWRRSWAGRVSVAPSRRCLVLLKRFGNL